MNVLASLAVAAMVTLVAPVAAWSTTVVVAPGPGTPLQDAINAAAPRSKLLLQGGTFTEAIVINKALSLSAAPMQTQVIIDASSTNAAFAVDITADRVELKATRDGPYLKVIGGATAA